MKSREQPISLEGELESALAKRIHEQDKFLFPKEVRALMFFQNLPFKVSGVQERNYDEQELSESKAYDTSLKDLVTEKEANLYSAKRLELTEREFLNLMYQAVAQAGYTREWLQKMEEKANNDKLTDDEFAQYLEALKKIYLLLRREGFSHLEILV